MDLRVCAGPSFCTARVSRDALASAESDFVRADRVDMGLFRRRSVGLPAAPIYDGYGRMADVSVQPVRSQRCRRMSQTCSQHGVPGPVALVPGMSTRPACATDSPSNVFGLIEEGAIRTVKIERARLVPVANFRAFPAAQNDSQAWPSRGRSSAFRASARRTDCRTGLRAWLSARRAGAGDQIRFNPLDHEFVRVRCGPRGVAIFAGLMIDRYRGPACLMAGNVTSRCCKAMTQLLCQRLCVRPSGRVDSRLSQPSEISESLDEFASQRYQLAAPLLGFGSCSRLQFAGQRPIFGKCVLECWVHFLS
ncbi:MAG: hypothetical protein JWR80_1551 [Bradyrhizobium sp.]|nr:hypothetical protein [Bradyrhizobium sp.]